MPVPNTELLEAADAVWSAVAEEEARLGDAGRVLLRPSGTEPLVRVMVEASGDGVAEADRRAARHPGRDSSCGRGRHPRLTGPGVGAGPRRQVADAHRSGPSDR